jgi:hypothetical protein
MSVIHLLPVLRRLTSRLPSYPVPLYITMEKLDQGHLHPKLEVPRLTCFGRESHGGRRALKQRAIYSDSTLISIPNIYIWARNMAPPNACVYKNILYMNTHELHYDVCWIALSSHSTLNIDIRHLQVYVFTVKKDRSHRGHYYGETWPRPSPSSTRGARTDMSWMGIKPRPQRWEASTQAKSYLNSVLIAIRNIYI